MPYCSCLRLRHLGMWNFANWAALLYEKTSCRVCHAQSGQAFRCWPWARRHFGAARIGICFGFVFRIGRRPALRGGLATPEVFLTSRPYAGRSVAFAHMGRRALLVFSGALALTLTVDVRSRPTRPTPPNLTAGSSSSWASWGSLGCTL